MGLFTDGFKLLKKASEPLYKTPKSIQETIEIIPNATAFRTSITRQQPRMSRSVFSRDTASS